MDSCGARAERRRRSEEELRGGEALDNLHGPAAKRTSPQRVNGQCGRRGACCWRIGWLEQPETEWKKLRSPSVSKRGPLSPLLSNLVLDELDRELERRGHRYLRYADDCNIYVRSQRAGQRVMESITRFITQKLKLKVNETKSAVARPQERKLLGFSFSAGPEIKRMIAPKALDRFKQRIREITRKAKGVSIEKTIEELASYMRGWRGYFGFCETPVVLEYLTRWVRLRLRAALWRQWKTSRRRRAALLELGVRPRLASNTAGSGRGPWYLARAKALSVGLSNAYFKSLGLPTLIDGC